MTTMAESFGLWPLGYLLRKQRLFIVLVFWVVFGLLELTSKIVREKPLWPPWETTGAFHLRGDQR